MSKRFLILDDDQGRIDMYLSSLAILYKNCHIVVVRHADECICELSKSVFDIVFLDRSLNGKANVPDDDPDCGDVVVDFLTQNHEIRKMHKCYVVHSLDAKARRMAFNLRQFKDCSVQYSPGMWEELRSCSDKLFEKI